MPGNIGRYGAAGLHRWDTCGRGHAALANGQWLKCDRIFDTVAEAEAFFIERKRDPSVFDGDGLEGTLPDPYVRELQCKEPESVILDGIEFPLQIDNIMGYWDFATKTFTTDQAARLNWLVELRFARRMAMPTNFYAANPVEFDSLPVLASRDMFYIRQDMEYFGIDQWAEDDQLFCGAGSNGLIAFKVDVPRDGTYQIELYATRAPDFGIVETWLDGNRISGNLDFYAPIVRLLAVLCG